jgi:hypothetical protein
VKSYRVIVLIASFAVGAAVWSASGSDAQERPKGGKAVVPPPHPKIEYKVLPAGTDDQDTEKLLNKFGDEGWELVAAPGSVSAPATGQGSSQITTKVRLVLKRTVR